MIPSNHGKGFVPIKKAMCAVLDALDREETTLSRTKPGFCFCAFAAAYYPAFARANMHL